MKRRIIQLSFALFAIGLPNILAAQQVDKKVLNWYNGKQGMQTEAAYKMVKKRTSKTVVVAIIDSGMDIDHEDLKGQIWVNTKEIAGNGIDDDGNGYIDDVNGWNFLGNAKGEHQNYARLEMTRIYAQLAPKYENFNEDTDKVEDPAEYALFKEVREAIAERRAEYEPYLGQFDQIKMFITQVPTIVAAQIGKQNYTLKDLNKWKPKDAQGLQLKQFATAILDGSFSEEAIKGQEEQIKQMLDYNLNPDYEDRAFVGDNPMDINDRGYGNSDVQGPDALHGTHVGGIVGSLRGNGLGGDGVAADVKLMSLRAVPNGDEFDKDIALAIRYAVDNGASIINMSFGKSYSPLAKDVYEAIKYADEKGVLMVHAAGNDAKDIDTEPNFPTYKFEWQNGKKLDHYITIGASTKDHSNKKKEVNGLAANFSNYGQVGVEVFAPGNEIYNTVPGNKYRSLQGTSMAAPMVSGAAAFLKSYFPTLTMKEIKEILLKSATNFKGTQQEMPGTGEAVDFAKLSVTGGTINLPEAVKLCIAMEQLKAAK